MAESNSNIRHAPVKAGWQGIKIRPKDQKYPEGSIPPLVRTRRAPFDGRDHDAFPVGKAEEENTPCAHAPAELPVLPLEELHVALKRIEGHRAERGLEPSPIRRRDTLKRLSCGSGEEHFPRYGSGGSHRV